MPMECFQFKFPDLTATANELEISERMLGYILAMLQEYGTEATFEKIVIAVI